MPCGMASLLSRFLARYSTTAPVLDVVSATAPFAGLRPRRSRSPVLSSSEDHLHQHHQRPKQHQHHLQMTTRECSDVDTDVDWSRRTRLPLCVVSSLAFTRLLIVLESRTFFFLLFIVILGAEKARRKEHENKSPIYCRRLYWRSPIGVGGPKRVWRALTRTPVQQTPVGAVRRQAPRGRRREGLTQDRSTPTDATNRLHGSFRGHWRNAGLLGLVADPKAPSRGVSRQKRSRVPLGCDWWSSPHDERSGQRMLIAKKTRPNCDSDTPCTGSNHGTVEGNVGLVRYEQPQ